MLTEENLRRTVFPLGGLTKPEVRQIAFDHGFEKLSKKTESQEICFVPNNDYRQFLSEQGVQVPPGKSVNAERKLLGEHTGFCNYTIGQRKGLGIALGTPQFVTKIDAARNEVTLGSREDLYSTEVHADSVRLRDVEWLRSSPTVSVRIRYKSPAVPARIDLSEYTSEYPVLRLHFDQPVWGITPGQSLVIYKDELVVGGGLIAQ